MQAGVPNRRVSRCCEGCAEVGTATAARSAFIVFVGERKQELSCKDWRVAQALAVSGPACA